MSSTGLDVFDKTVQTTNLWLKEIMEDEAIGPDKQLAWRVLGAVLRTVRDRMPVELAAHLGAELPLLIRGAYYDQFRPEILPGRERSREAFLQMIGAELAASRPVNVERATRAVLSVLSHYVNPDQVAKIRETMPAEVRAIWPDPDAPKRRAGAAG